VCYLRVGRRVSRQARQPDSALAESLASVRAFLVSFIKGPDSVKTGIPRHTSGTLERRCHVCIH
jgi:hypothetical protein